MAEEEDRVVVSRDGTKTMIAKAVDEFYDSIREEKSKRPTEFG